MFSAQTLEARRERLTPEQRAEIKARVATWSPLTEAQRAQVATLFGPYLNALGKRPDRPS